MDRVIIHKPIVAQIVALLSPLDYKHLLDAIPALWRKRALYGTFSKMALVYARRRIVHNFNDEVASWIFDTPTTVCMGYFNPSSRDYHIGVPRTTSLAAIILFFEKNGCTLEFFRLPNLAFTKNGCTLELFQLPNLMREIQYMSTNPTLYACYNGHVWCNENPPLGNLGARIFGAIGAALAGTVILGLVIFCAVGRSTH